MEMQLPKSRRCYTWTPTKNTKVSNMHTHKHMYTHTFSTSGRYSCRAFVSDDLIPSTLSTSHFKNSWLSRRFSCARHNSNHKVHVNLYHNNQCQQSIFFFLPDRASWRGIPYTATCAVQPGLPLLCFDWWRNDGHQSDCHVFLLRGCYRCRFSTHTLACTWLERRSSLHVCVCVHVQVCVCVDLCTTLKYCVCTYMQTF